MPLIFVGMVTVYGAVHASSLPAFLWGLLLLGFGLGCLVEEVSKWTRK